MVSVNSVVLGGNLTRDPELKYLPNGTAVCDLNIAVNKKWTDKGTGEKKESVAFVGVVAFARTAEMAAQHLKKGAPVLIEGELTQDRWEDKTSGQKREKTKVTAQRVHFLDWKRQESEPVVVVDDEKDRDGGL